MSRSDPRIAIFGAGSIGCYLGGCLLSAGNQVVMIGRDRIKNELTEFGLTVTDYQGRSQTVPTQSLKFSTSPEAISDADFILLTVKSGDTSKVAQDLKQYAKPNAVIISFQNGIRNGDMLRQHIQNQTLLTGMVPFNVAHKKNGRFHCGTEGNLTIEQNINATSQLIECFEKSSLPIESHTDMRAVQWGKLLLNLNNAINALSGQPLLEQLNNNGYRKILVASIQEALSILQTAKIHPAKVSKVPPQLLTKILSLPNWVFQRISTFILKIDANAISSMAEDLALNRVTEIDYLNGEIVSLAKRIETTAPINDAIVKLIKQAETNQAGSPKLAPNQILKAIESSAPLKSFNDRN